MFRYRLTYAKTEPLRYTATLDLHKVWERALRRAKLPLLYSQGFHPQPRLVQASPLPLGVTAKAELVDIWLKSPVSPDQIQQCLTPALPPGIELGDVAEIDINAPPLPTRVLSAVYQVTLLNPLPARVLQERLNALLQVDSLPRVRRNKAFDLRPLIEDACITEAAASPGLIMQLAARAGATGRADEVLDALVIPAHAARIERLHLLLAD